MLKINALFLVLINIATLSYGQDTYCNDFYMTNNSVNENNNISVSNNNLNFFSSVTIGGIELFSLSAGKYITNDLTFDVKWAMFGVNGGVGTGAALSTPASLGLGINYFIKNIILIGYFSADYLRIYGDGFNGNGFEFVAGNCTNKEKGLGFIYELGIGYSNVLAHYSVPQYQRKTLIGPIIKIGLNYNF